MALTRSKILRGPCKVIYDTITWWTPDDVTIALDDGGEDRHSSMFGLIDRQVVDPKIQAEFTPQAYSSGGTPTFAQILAKVVPAIFTNGYYGTSYIGAGAEKSAIIWSSNGDQVTIYNAVITKPPQLTFSADKPIFGSMTLTGIPCTTAGDITLAAANSLYKSEEAIADPGGNFSGIAAWLQRRHKGVWGTQAGFTDFYPESGFTVDFGSALKPRKIQGLTVDYELDNMEIMVKCVPAQPTMKQIFDMIGIGGTSGATKGQGSLMSSQQTTDSLTIVEAGGTTVFTLNTPIIRKPGFKFGYDVLRVGELEWYSQIRFTAGVPAPLASF